MVPRLKGVIGIVALAAFAAGAAPAFAQAPCDRACLTKIIDGYLAALIANDARALPQAARARITTAATVISSIVSDIVWR